MSPLGATTVWSSNLCAAEFPHYISDPVKRASYIRDIIGAIHLWDYLVFGQNSFFDLGKLHHKWQGPYLQEEDYSRHKCVQSWRLMEKFIFLLGQAGPQLLQNMSLPTEETSFINSQNPSSTAQGNTNKEQFLVVWKKL